MSTPTEPTTPQPKPPDAAGLRWHNPDNLPSAGEPPWRFLVEGEKKPEDAELYDCGGDWVEASDIDEPSPRVTYRTKRPLPTPHAAEAGDVAAAADVLDFIKNHPGWLFDSQENRAKIAAILARHRTAAETVGTGWMPIETAPKDGCAVRLAWNPEDWTTGEGFYRGAQWVACAAFYNSTLPHPSFELREIVVQPACWQPLPPFPGEPATPPATQSAGAIAAVLDMAARGRSCGTLDVQKAQAELAATQSALEQAREALGHLQWCSSCCQESWENCEGGRQALQALAALNAVLPPAKGGDGV